jgi:hypothetical protein
MIFCQIGVLNSNQKCIHKLWWMGINRVKDPVLQFIEFVRILIIDHSEMINHSLCHFPDCLDLKSNFHKLLMVQNTSSIKDISGF